jgi:outer membrane protein TolC
MSWSEPSRQIRSGLFLCGLITFLVLPAIASETIGLDDAIRRALEHNHQLRAADHSERAAAWAHRQAIANLLPSISVESSYTRLDDETVARANAFGREITFFFPDSAGELQPFTVEIPQTVFRDGYETSISAQVLLLNPSLLNGVSLAGTSKELAAAELESTVQETIHSTLTAFLELLRIRSLTELQEQHLEQAHKNVALAERLLAVGRYAEADVLRWRVEEARQNGLLYSQRSAQIVAALSLENLIGAEPLGEIVPESELPDQLVTEIERFRNLGETDWEEFMQMPLESLIAGNPQQRLLDLSERVAELEHRQSLAAFMPSVTIGGAYGWQNNDTFELDGDKAWAVTAALSVPVFTSGANYSGRQVTKHKLLQTREVVRGGHRELLLGGEAARTGIRNHTAQLALAEVNRENARRNHEIMENNFRLGRLTNLEWIDANLALQEAEETHTSAYYDLVLAIADYLYAIGRIDLLLLNDPNEQQR